MIDVRTIEPSELHAWIEAMYVVYFMDRPVEEEARYRAERVDYARTIGGFDRERVVATFRSFPSELTVPGGGCVSADAVTNVGVLPTHRRQGLLNRMMALDLRAAADRGEAVAILFASEASIYGRYGFGVATEHAQLLLRKANVRFRDAPAAGTVELVSFTDMRQIVPPVYERFRLAQPGSMAIEGKRWDAMFGIGPTPFGPKPGDRAAIFRDEAGVPQGWLRYRGEETWTELRPAGRLDVQELVAVTPDAYARLWRFATEIDLMAEIRAEQRPIVEPLPWLLVDRRAVHQTARHDGLWVRVLDTATTLAARRYAAPGRLVVEVRDDAGLAGGRFLLEGGPDGARCEPTAAQPDVSLTVEALGAAYLGWTNLGLLARAGLAAEQRRGSLAVAEAMFASNVVPWCWTEF